MYSWQHKKICLKHLSVFQNCLPSLMLKNCTGSLRNENSICLLLTLPVTQLLYTQCVIRIQANVTALLLPTQSEKSVTSKFHNIPCPWTTSGHSIHWGPTGYKPGHRAQNLESILQGQLCWLSVVSLFKPIIIC